jgi:hypothetical protein
MCCVHLQWVLAYSGFPFPIALTLWHMTFCSAVGFIAVRVCGLVKSHNMSFREYCTRVMPIGKAVKLAGVQQGQPLQQSTGPEWWDTISCRSCTTA